MSLAKQVGLLPAGCQPWNSDVVAASGDRFAYCATLAIYIYQLDRQFNEFKLLSIMSEHKKTISAISWNPKDVDLFCSAGADNQVIIWNVAEEQVVAKLQNTRGTPCSLGWCLHEKDCVAFVSGRGPLFLWKYDNNDGLSNSKEAQNFMSDVCQFRWHPNKSGKMAFGHVDGSMSIFNPGQRPQKHVLRPENMEGSDEEDPVTALEWDPLSTDYLLVSSTHGGIRMVDSESLITIMVFVLPSAAAQVHTLAWIASAPGMFATGDSLTGVMRIWNVSKQTPIENIRLKKTGFHALHVFVSSAKEPETSKSPSHTSSTSPALPPASPKETHSHYALPPAHAVCTFLDGGVGLYDLGHRKWTFLRDLGHIETIFDCKFKPENPDHLATASFDGTIKVWDINTLCAVHSSPGNEGVIYSLSWAPADLNCIAASTSRNGAFIWDLTKGKILRRFTEHGKAAVFSVAWNHKDSRRIATCGGDGFCVVRLVDGKPLMRYKHPGPAYGCDWSPHNKDMLATGCEDKKVRVFYLATNSDQPLKVFSGHTAKVFHVRWSHLREGILCSGSDDCTIRVWDYTQECCTHILQGHNGPVRGLLWNPEIPYLLVSGSWDYSIRIWDTRDGACLDTLLDHGADVYGLTCHPDRPFVLGSCSRDSTVRIWSLCPIVQPLEMNIIAGRPWSEILATPEQAYVQGCPALLAGKASRDLKLQIDKLPGDSYPKILQLFSKFFASPAGVLNLWELVSIVRGRDDNQLSNSYSKHIMHKKHITKFKSAAAQELEMVKVSKFGAGIGAPSRDDRLREAADIHIRLGNIQRYCELMVELGEWEKALAVAPGVSMVYWKSLAERRAQHLVQEDSDGTIPYCVATGKSEQLVQFFSSRGQLHEAMMSATAVMEGNISVPQLRKPQRSSMNGLASDSESEANFGLLKKASDNLANWYFRNGCAVQSACCHLAADDMQGAICKLLRGHELELLISVGSALGHQVAPLTHLAIEYLSRRAERIGRWELGVHLLQRIPVNDILVARLCARCAASIAERDALHEQAGLPSVEECGKEGEHCRCEGLTLKAVKFFLLSNSPEIALELGLEDVKSKMVGQWTVNDVFEMLQLLSSIQTEKLQHHACSRFRGELLILCAYMGALVALRRRYDSIVGPLFQHTLQLMKREQWSASLSESLVQSELAAWKAKQAILYNLSPASSPSRPDSGITIEQQQIFEEVERKGGMETSGVEPGMDLISGSNLPSHSDVHHSCLTGHRIQGPSFFLEDGRSALSISDAVMWAKVNSFSPLGSGIRINPF